jgi:hypothetical protein
MDAVRLAQLLRQMPENNNEGYDMQAYLAKYGQPQVPAPYASAQGSGMHLTDEFKMPNHKTFSSGSSYSAPDMQGGQWQSGGKDRWNFQPSELNLQNRSTKDLADYFANEERKNTFITLPNGQLVEGSR